MCERRVRMLLLLLLTIIIIIAARSSSVAALMTNAVSGSAKQAPLAAYLGDAVRGDGDADAALERERERSDREAERLFAGASHAQWADLWPRICLPSARLSHELWLTTTRQIDCRAGRSRGAVGVEAEAEV